MLQVLKQAMQDYGSTHKNTPLVGDIGESVQCAQLKRETPIRGLSRLLGSCLIKVYANRAFGKCAVVPPISA